MVYGISCIRGLLADVIICILEFADPPPALVAALPLPKVPRAASRVDESIVPETGPPPTTLMHWAVLILNTANPVLKVRTIFLFISQFTTKGRFQFFFFTFSFLHFYFFCNL